MEERRGHPGVLPQAPLIGIPPRTHKTWGAASSRDGRSQGFSSFGPLREHEASRPCSVNVRAGGVVGEGTELWDARIHTHMHTHPHTCTQTHAHTHAHTCMDTHVDTWTLSPPPLSPGTSGLSVVGWGWPHSPLSTSSQAIVLEARAPWGLLLDREEEQGPGGLQGEVQPGHWCGEGDSGLRGHQRVQ